MSLFLLVILILESGNQDSFTILEQGCSPAEILPQTTCAAEVQFAPNTADQYESQLVVKSPDGNIATVPVAGLSIAQSDELGSNELNSVPQYSGN